MTQADLKSLNARITAVEAFMSELRGDVLGEIRDAIASIEVGDTAAALECLRFAEAMIGTQEPAP